MSATYFDEAYFQDGASRGTAYSNYREVSRTNPMFREIARALLDVFRPRRALEVGCATGIMVKYLNEAGCDAHGIDVSEWAVANREHPNVRLASAAELPYESGSFDLVYSCHSIEHLPDAVVRQGLAEIVRVSAGFHFHMLPMVGTPPYVGPADVIIANLRKDPTHNQLHPAEWWRTSFESLGLSPLQASLHFTQDNDGNELTFGQLFFVKPGAPVDVGSMLARAFDWNRHAFVSARKRPEPPAPPLAGHMAAPVGISSPRRPAPSLPPPPPMPSHDSVSMRSLVARALRRASNHLHPLEPVPTFEPAPLPPTPPEDERAHLTFTERVWKDVNRELEVWEELSLRDNALLLVVTLAGAECNMRLALADDRHQERFANCLEYGMRLKPGLNWSICAASDFRVLRGQPDLSRINRIAFGGEAQGAELRVWLLDSTGRELLGA